MWRCATARSAAGRRTGIRSCSGPCSRSQLGQRNGSKSGCGLRRTGAPNCFGPRRSKARSADSARRKRSRLRSLARKRLRKWDRHRTSMLRSQAHFRSSAIIGSRRSGMRRGRLFACGSIRQALNVSRSRGSGFSIRRNRLRGPRHGIFPKAVTAGRLGNRLTSRLSMPMGCA